MSPSNQNPQNLKPFDDEVLDVKKQSLYARLKRLFSTDVIVRNVGGKQLKIKDTDSIMYATDRNSLRDRFNRIRSSAYNAYTRDFALSYQAARMDLFRDYDTMDMDPILSCLAPTTYVSTLDGFVTIKDLAEKYPNGEYFKVWSWDKDNHKLTLGNAHHPRKTGTKNVIELHLDNGKIVKCTPDHRMMLINGTYKEAGKLLPGESLMPFYHRVNDNGYQEIKSFGSRFKPTHRYIFEDVLQDIDLDGYNIHHRNHNKLDNNLNNLEKITAIEHCKLHGISPITNGKRSEKCKNLWVDSEYRSKCSSALNRWRNSDEGKKMMSEHTSILNKNRWENDTEYVLKMTQIFSDHAKSLWNDSEWKEWKRKKHSETMKLKYANDSTYAEKTKHIGKDNGQYKECITTESILAEGIKFNSLIDFAKSFDFQGLTFKNDQYRCQFLSRRLNAAGYNGWEDYKSKFNYSNHKVNKIVDNNEITEVYDLTVDFYENFALEQGIICSNSALDIYADECVHGDTIIPLVNGEEIRIEDLYKEQRTNFVVYSLDNDGNQISAVCDRVALNGQKQMLKLTLDDNTEIKCTAEHQWLNQHGKIVTTNELSDGYILSNNHRVVSVELDGIYDAYDLVNVGHSTHLYAIKTKGGSNLFTHNCLTYNEVGKMITVHSTNNNVKRILENLFDEILNVRFNLWSWVRNMTKYGDFYLKLYVTPEYGVYMVEPISAYNVERIENSDPSNKRYVKFQLRPTDTSQSEILENYEVAHFRLISDSNFLPYGKSMIEGARRVWKQLSLMEDAMLISRIMRAPERRIFYTDIGNIPPNEVDAYMQKMMDKMKKVPYIDEQTGEYNLRFNLQNMIEDYYIPVRGGDSGTRIDTLAGMEWTGIDDLEYVKTKMMAALKIPKAFLGYEEGISGKATLASEDVRFARTIQRLQRIISSELSKIAIVHLYAQGYRDESLVDFEIELTNPSTIFEKEKIEIWQDKIGVASDMTENKFFSFNWVYKNIFNMSEDDIKEVREEVVEDMKQRYRLTSIEEDGNDPAKPFKKIEGGKGGDGGGDGNGGGMSDIGGGGGHGGGGGLPDLDDLDDIGGDEGGKDGKDKGKEGDEGEDKGKDEEPDLKKIKEVVDDRDRSDRVDTRDRSDRDQTGEKKAPAIAEDPIGALARTAQEKEKSEGKRKNALSHNYEGGSPLRLRELQTPVVDKELISSLSGFLKKTHADTKKELLRENHNSESKSMLDESGIL